MTKKRHKYKSSFCNYKNDELEYNQQLLSINSVKKNRNFSNQIKFRPAIRISILVCLIILINNPIVAQIISNDYNNLFSNNEDNNWSSTTRKSELIFDNQELELIPIDRICKYNNSNNETEFEAKKKIDIINLVSFAHNNLKIIEENSFICVASFLKILILRYNQIEEILPKAFNKLESVQVLLLDNNKLKKIPSKEILNPMKSLRHLNLADNRIESIEDETFGIENVNLISLNLKGNPLHEIGRNSFIHLVKLKTLTLSQTLLKGQMIELNGLIELRYYHLDRAANLQTITENLCESSRKLTTLVLKSNNFERIPQFKKCQNLLLLDLSYNKIFGNLNKNFTQFPALIDLYLGFNQINSIDEDAFYGLENLQVLELNDNQIFTIHSNAFNYVRNSIFDLNLSNNKQLKKLNSTGLDRLISLKSYGNLELKELPKFKSALSLALTYAYHCCDYIDSYNYNDNDHNNNNYKNENENENENNLLFELINSIFIKFRGFFSPTGSGYYNHSTSSVADFTSGDEFQNLKLFDKKEKKNKKKKNYDDYDFRENNIENLSEIILWPKSKLFDNENENVKGEGERKGKFFLVDKQEKQQQQQQQNQMNIVNLNVWKTEVIGVKRITRDNKLIESNLQSEQQEVEKKKFELMKKEEIKEEEDEDLFRCHSLKQNNKNCGLIDELVLVIKQIRISHKVGIWQSKLGKKTFYYDDDDDNNNGREKFFFPIYEKNKMNNNNGMLTNSSSNNNNNNNNFRFEEKKFLNEASKLLKDELLNDYYYYYDENVLIKRNFFRQTRDTFASSSLDKKQHYRKNNFLRQCLPEPNPFLPCKDLFDTWWLRLGIWCVFLCSFIGNMLVIIVLTFVRQSNSSSALTNIMWLNSNSKRHIDVPRFLIINLAIADLLMSLYLGLLAFVDLTTIGKFKFFSIKWQYSIGCKLASFLAVLSSELSVFILAIITLERNYAITNAVHLNRRLSLQKAMFIMFLGYLFAFLMAIMPLNGINDYKKFSICLPLDIDSTNLSKLYIISLLSINSISFLLLLTCYLRMYFAIRGSQAWNTNDLRIAKRMSILVITDFLCWFPIIIISLASLFGYKLIDLLGIKILTIFILPLNSIANPFLYAITTKKFKRDLTMLNRRFKTLILSNCSYCSILKSSSSTNWPYSDNNNNNKNNYNNNLMFMNENQKNYYLMRSKARKKQQQQQKAIDQQHQLEQSNYDHFNTRQQQQQQQQSQRRRRQLQQQALANRFLTANQVTINRTTCCSCQQQLLLQQQTLLNNNNNNNNYDEINQSNLGPKIVLEAAIEPSLNVAIAPCGLSVNSFKLNEDNNNNNRPQTASIEIKSANCYNIIKSQEVLSAKNSNGESLGKQTSKELSIVKSSNNNNSNSNLKDTEEQGCSSLSNYEEYNRLTINNGKTNDCSPPEVSIKTGNNNHNHHNSCQEMNYYCCLNETEKRSIIDNYYNRNNNRTYLSVSPNTNHYNKYSYNSLYINNNNINNNDNNDKRPASACDYNNKQNFNLNEEKSIANSCVCDEINNKLYLAESHNPIIAKLPSNSKLLKGTKSIVTTTTTTTTKANTCDKCSACNFGKKKLSSSINRLLFSPIAKAWSSLQISLSSNAVNNNKSCCYQHHQQHYCENNNRQKETNCFISKTPNSSTMFNLLSMDTQSNNISGDINSENNQTKNTDIIIGDTNEEQQAMKIANQDEKEEEEEEDKVDDLTIDDILLMSPGSSLNLFRINERRMSRSCDMITQQNKDSLSYLISPTQSTNEQTTTQNDSTQINDDDDRRVLLATIKRISGGAGAGSGNHRNHKRYNQLNKSNNKSEKEANLLKYNSKMIDSFYLNNKSRCTRCRSWSPALLGKLEDCINQIKYKFPTLKTTTTNKIIKSNNIPEGSNRLNEQSTTTSNFSNSNNKYNNESSSCQDYNQNIDDVNFNNDLEKLNNISNCGEIELEEDDLITTSSISSSSTSLSSYHNENNKLNLNNHNQIEEEEDYLESDDDKFNDPLNWAQKRMNLVRLQHSRRRQLQKESSLNSDNLSIRTAGTMFTNMSISIDSTTATVETTSNIPQQQQGSSNNYLDAEIEKPQPSCSKNNF